MSVDASALERLGQNLRDYALVSKLTISEILEKKGNDLRIQLFRGFWDHKMGGKGGKKRGIAFRELARRTKAGIGTFVRLKFLDEKWLAGMPEVTKSGKPLSLWQKLVYQETQRRDAGVGILGVSFLSRRFRQNKDRGQYLVTNNSPTLGSLVTITKTEDSYTVRGMTPGMSKIADRYGIKEAALNKVSDDMEPYLARKFGEAWEKALKGRAALSQR